MVKTLNTHSRYNVNKITSFIADKDSAKQLSNTVDSACVLLTDYNKRLASEMDERRSVAKMLRAFVIAQTEQLQHAEKRLQVSYDWDFRRADSRKY